MANGDDNPFGIGNIEVVSGASDLEQLDSLSRDTLLTFSNPVPDEPSDFRTGQADKLQGLVKDLANARVDAAREREQMREQAARNANARLLSTIGSQSLTQALTGVNTGSTEQAQQAQQTLQKAEEARRQAEAEAEKVEETAPLQAEVKGTEIEQQAQQRAQEAAQRGKEMNIQQIQNSLETVQNARNQARSFDVKQELAKQEHKFQKDLLNTRFNRREDLARIRNSDGGSFNISSEELKERQNTLASYLGAVQTLNGQVKEAFKALKEGADSNDEGQRVERKLKSVSQNIKSMIGKKGEPGGVIEMEQKLRSKGLWGALPDSTKKKINRIEDVGNTLAGTVQERNVSASDYSRVLRPLRKKYFGTEDSEGVANWSPSTEVMRGTLERSVSPDSSGGNNPSGIKSYWGSR